MASFEALKAKIPAVEWAGPRRAGRGPPGGEGPGRGRVDPRGDRPGRAGLRDAPGVLDPGDSEKDAADALEGYLRRCGASATSLPADRRRRATAAQPHARPTRSARVRDADFVLVHWEPRPARYKSDLTRVLVTGKVTPKFERIYRTVLAAQERGIEALRPGARAGTLTPRPARRSRRPASAATSPTGWGMASGLEIHETPFFRRDHSATLKAGMVVTVEPGIYLPDWAGSGSRTTCWSPPDGPEVLTRSPRSLESAPLR